MEHKSFRVFSLFILLINLVFIFLYNYINFQKQHFYEKIFLKLIPSLCNMSIPIFYYFKYRITIYALLIHLTLFFCLVGDLLLGLYNPDLLETVNFKEVYLIVGGFAFLLARMSILLAMILYPSTRFKLIRHNYISLILSHLLFNIPFVIVAFAVFSSKLPGLIYASIILYILLGFGMQLSYSFLRINAIDGESRYSSIIGFLGILFFNISDILLLVTMFTNFLPSYCLLISDNIYWLGIFLLSISIVRSPYVVEERGMSLNDL